MGTFIVSSQSFQISSQKLYYHGPSSLLSIGTNFTYSGNGPFKISSQSLNIQHPSGSIQITNTGKLYINSLNFSISSNLKLSGQLNFAKYNTLIWDKNDGVVISGSYKNSKSGIWSSGPPGISSACGWVRIKIRDAGEIIPGREDIFYGFIPIFSANRINNQAQEMSRGEGDGFP